MDKEIIEYLEKILANHYGIIFSIEHTTLITAKPLRTVFLIEAIKENRPERFILHIRQKSYHGNREEEIEVLKTALANGVFTFELIHYDISGSNPFDAAILLETYIQGDHFLDRKDWFKGHHGNLFSNMERLHRVKCDRKSPEIQDFMLLPKYRNECLLKLAGSKLIDVPLLEKMFAEVLLWQKEIDFSTHTSLLHGDLHYSNMIISAENCFYLIDWEMASVGDYCKDLAYFKARTLDYLYPGESGLLFNTIMAHYKAAFREGDLDIRMRYYLSYRYLEIIWRCCFPRLSEQWLRFYFEKYCEFRWSISL